MAYSEPIILPFNPFPNLILPPGAPALAHPSPLLFPPRPSLPLTSPSPLLQKFTLFPTLPLELRLLIARHTLPLHTSRIVLTRPYAISERTRPTGMLTHKKSEFLFSSTSLPPIALSVNREFRGEALRFYQPSFGFDHPALGSEIYFQKKSGIGKRIVDDCEGDDVLYFEFTGSPFYSNLGYFTATIMGEGCSRLDLGAVTRIALSHRLVVGRQNAIRKLGRRLEVFERLREIVVVIESGENSEDHSGKERVVGREARLVELGDRSGWDEETRALVDEVEGAKVLWEVLAWRDTKSGDLRKMPTLKVMEIENLEERPREIFKDENEDGIIEDEENTAGPAGSSRKETSGVGQLTKIWKKLWVGGKTE